MKIKKNKKVYTLHSRYKDDDSESIGVYDSPRAMMAGLAADIYDDHAALRDAKPKEIAEIVALAVFDLVSICEFKSDREECRDGDTVFGCSEDEVQSLDEKEKEDA